MANKFTDCVIGKLGEDAPDKATIEQALDEIQREIDARIARHGESLIQAAAKASERRKFFSQMRALNGERAELLKARAAINLTARISELKDTGVKAVEHLGKGEDFKAIEAIMGGNASSAKTAKLSVDAQGVAMNLRYLGGIIGKLESRGLLSYVNNRDNYRNIAVEYMRMNSKRDMPGTGDADAEFVAKLFNTAMEDLRQKSNLAGADIRELDGFYGVQRHDATKISNVSADVWKSKLVNLLDWERMNVLPEERAEWLDNAYESLASGKQYGFGSPATANRLSQAREMHFKGPDAWMKYNDEFGSGNLIENFVFSIERRTRDLALMREFGPNPKAMLDNMKNQYKLSQSEARALDNLFKELDGSIYNPVNPSIASIGSGIRIFNNITMLGGMIISSLPDLSVKAAALQRGGNKSFLGAWGETLAGLKPMGRENIRAVSDIYGAGYEGFVSALGVGSFANDGVMGAMARGQRLFFKLNIAQWWNNANKSASTRAFSAALGHFKDVKYDGVETSVRRMMQAYGIDANDWEVARSFVRELGDGRSYLTPDLIEEADLSAFKSIAKGDSVRQLTEARDALALKVRTFVTDRANYATLTPNARNRALLDQGLERGTVMGEALRLMTQFKQFPVTFVSRVWGESLHFNGKADIPMMAQLMVSMTALGYAANTLSEYARGKEPSFEITPEAVKRAFVRSGAGGVYADILFPPDWMKAEQRIINILGPSASRLASMASALEKAEKSKADVPYSVSKELIRMIPGNNIFYLRPALDYIILRSMIEAGDPGAMARIEGYAKKSGTPYFMSPRKTLLEDLK